MNYFIGVTMIMMFLDLIISVIYVNRVILVTKTTMALTLISRVAMLMWGATLLFSSAV